MKAIKPATDIVPLSEFRANVTDMLRRVQESGGPIVVTQHGRGAGVLLSAAEYQQMVDTIEFMRAVAQGQADAGAGRTIEHKQAVAGLDALVSKVLKRKPRKVPA